MTSLLDEGTLRAALADPEGVTLIGDLLMALDATPDGAWSLLGRPDQQEPDGDWLVWLILAGRGWGKTRTLSEAAHRRVRQRKARRLAIVGATAADVRDVLVEGETGLLATAPTGWRPNYEPSKRRLTWPNGAVASLFSADEPDRLRGPQHDLALCDEVAAWRYPEAWDMLMMGLRLGYDPRAIAVTTPRPTRLIRDLVAGVDSRSGQPVSVHVSRGSTYDNLPNLAPTFRAQVLSRYEGTRLGRQELNAELLDDTPGALWTQDQLDRLRAAVPTRREVIDKAWAEVPDLTRVVVAVDPAATSGEDSDETGIVVCGIGSDGLLYVVDDRSCRLSPDGWARRVAEAADDWQADRIVAERNQGGEMVAHTLHTVAPHLSVRPIHAVNGKRLRAEPVAALYEQGKVRHVGVFSALETQMTTCTLDGVGSDHDDRVDALVHAITELAVTPRRTLRFVA